MPAPPRARRPDAAAAEPSPRSRRKATSRLAPFIVATLALVVLVGTVIAFSGMNRRDSVAGLTSAPTASAQGQVPVISSVAPTPTQTVTPPSPTLAPRAAATPRPLPTTKAIAQPVVTPGPTPRPTRTPTPVKTVLPTPTPVPTCTVVNLVGLPSNKAQSTWVAAGFTGTVTFNPDVPPHYTITLQSRTPGAEISCTSGITVHGEP